MSVVSIYIYMISGIQLISGLFLFVCIQLVVRNSIQEFAFSCIDFLLWWLGNLPNRRNPTRREEPLAQLHVYFVWHHH
jgi:hypothetical protein